MDNSEKMCMMLFLIILAVQIGYTAFGLGMPEANSALPKVMLIDVSKSYNDAFSNLNGLIDLINKPFSLSTLPLFATGSITYGLGALISIGTFALVSAINTVTGYFSLLNWFGTSIESAAPMGGGIIALLSGLGIILSIMTLYGIMAFFKVIR